MVRRKYIRSLLVEIIIFCYVVLFLYAAGTKLIDHNSFVGQIGKSPLLAGHAYWIAWFIPFIEIAIAICLLIPKTRLRGLYASFGLMSAFTVYIIAIMTLSEKLPCACGGVLSSLHWKGHLILNISFLGLAIIAIFLIKPPGEPAESGTKLSFK